MVVKVMQINSGERFGGVSSMIFNFYKNIDKTKVQFDFVAPKKTSFEIYRDEITQMGGNIVELKTSGNFIKRKVEFIKRLSRLIKEKKYDVVHINSGSIFLNIQVAWIAKICGVNNVIAHSHNAGNEHMLMLLLTKLCKPLLTIGPDLYFACSNKAAEFMFTKKRIKNKEYKVINNAIDLNEFRFKKDVRKIYREKINAKEKTVMLHVGRFVKAKNHDMVIEIFNQYHKKNKQSMLLLVGEGELEKEIKEKVRNLNLSEDVLFMGLRKDVSSIMNAADVFLLPSFFEGLPVVGIEAQANGLASVFSDSITREVDLNDENNAFISLEEKKEIWSSAITKLLAKNKLNKREQASNIIKKSGYDLVDVSNELQGIYEKISCREEK